MTGRRLAISDLRVGYPQNRALTCCGPGTRTTAQWCGTELTAAWHLERQVVAAVYGHLHIPRTAYHDGVRFEEVSVGYPREWQRRGAGPPGDPGLLTPPW